MIRTIYTNRIGTVFEKKPPLHASAFIWLHDLGAPMPHADMFEGASSLLVPTDDIFDEQLTFSERIIFDCCKSKRRYEFAKNLCNKKSWPAIPFTDYHASQIIDFARDIGFDKDIYVFCEYGRSRSVTVANFLKQYMFPGYELKLSRNDARINPRIHRILTRVYGSAK